MLTSLKTRTFAKDLRRRGSRPKMKPIDVSILERIDKNANGISSKSAISLSMTSFQMLEKLPSALRLARRRRQVATAFDYEIKVIAHFLAILVSCMKKARAANLCL